MPGPRYLVIGSIPTKILWSRDIKPAMSEVKQLQSYLACPRCDKSPLSFDEGKFGCDACKIQFPDIDGIPWMFADPETSLGEWRNRLQFALQQLSHEISGLERELKNENLRPLTRRRVERYKKSTEQHRRSLQKLLKPVDLQSMSGNYESYLALRTRLPTDQGLNTYYANVHRDWCWGDEENNAALKQLQSVLHEHAELGDVLVIGAGAGRLAYDIHKQLNCMRVVVMVFNPLLMLVAQAMARGDRLFRAVGNPADHQAAGTADTFPAIAVKFDRSLVLVNQAFI